jgi:hypothetical protein
MEWISVAMRAAPSPGPIRVNPQHLVGNQDARVAEPFGGLHEVTDGSAVEARLGLRKDTAYVHTPALDFSAGQSYDKDRSTAPTPEPRLRKPALASGKFRVLEAKDPEEIVVRDLASGFGRGAGKQVVDHFV